MWFHRFVPDTATLVRTLVGGPVGFALWELYTGWLNPLIAGPRVISALVLGLATWSLALGVFAPPTDAPVMLNFGTFTWASLIGHVLMAAGIGAVVADGPRLRRAAAGVAA